jgi:hypothetical protein
MRPLEPDGQRHAAAARRARPGQRGPGGLERVVPRRARSRRRGERWEGGWHNMHTLRGTTRSRVATSRRKRSLVAVEGS